MSDKYKTSIFFAVLAIIVMAYYWFKHSEMKHFESFMPSTIELSEAVETGTESSLFRGGCGVAIFRLSENTSRRIEAEGLHFFDNATHPRDSINHPITYAPWNNTPLPHSWTSEGSWFMCSVTHGRSDSEIVEAAKRNGAYYTTNGNVQLVVVPSLRMVALSYYYG
jgi:hypothetical protein